MKPSYWICGAGGSTNCEYWDDVNGCWINCKDVYKCVILAKAEDDRDDLCEVNEDEN